MTESHVLGCSACVFGCSAAQELHTIVVVLGLACGTQDIMLLLTAPYPKQQCQKFSHLAYLHMLGLKIKLGGALPLKHPDQYCVASLCMFF